MKSVGRGSFNRRPFQTAIVVVAGQLEIDTQMVRTNLRQPIDLAGGERLVVAGKAQADARQGHRLAQLQADG